MSLIQRLKAKYPSKGFEQDPETAVITFEHDDVAIRDPFLTECGRFTTVPSEYGIDVGDALAIFDHNRDLPDEFAE